MSLCPFSKFNKIFGEPNEGIHKFRLLNVAAFDYISTLIGAIIISYLTKFPLVLTTIGAYSLGLFMHILFGVPTEAVKFLNRISTYLFNISLICKNQ